MCAVSEVELDWDSAQFGFQPVRRLWFDATEDTITALPFCGGELCSYCNRAPHKTTANEDAAGVFEVGPEQGVMLVADGVGGANCGDRAAQLLVESVAAHLDDVPKGKSLRSAILDGIESANREIQNLKLGAAATLAAVEFDAGQIRTYHIGDCQVLLSTNRGRIKHSTISHSLTALAIESGYLDEADALAHDERNVITNCVGSSEMRIEIGPQVTMGLRDTLLVASDGLFDNLLNEAIVEVIRKGRLLPQTETLVALTSRTMLRTSNDSPAAPPGKPDDLTILTFRR